MVLRPVPHYGHKRVQQSRSSDPKVGVGGCRQKGPRAISTVEQIDAEQAGVGQLCEPPATLYYAGNRGCADDVIFRDDDIPDLSCV